MRRGEIYDGYDWQRGLFRRLILYCLDWVTKRVAKKHVGFLLRAKARVVSEFCGAWVGSGDGTAAALVPVLLLGWIIAWDDLMVWIRRVLVSLIDSCQSLFAWWQNHLRRLVQHRRMDLNGRIRNWDRYRRNMGRRIIDVYYWTATRRRVGCAVNHCRSYAGLNKKLTFGGEEYCGFGAIPRCDVAILSPSILWLS